MYDQARIGGHRDTELNNDGTRSVISMENNGTLFPRRTFYGSAQKFFDNILAGIYLWVSWKTSPQQSFLNQSLLTIVNSVHCSHSSSVDVSIFICRYNVI